MDLNKKLKELKPQQLNCNVFDVYSYNGLTMQDLLCQFFTTINECVKSTNEVIDLTDWLINVGLEEEVVKKLMVLIEDGTVEKLINVNLFKTLNNEINGLSSQLEHNMNEIDNLSLSKMDKNTNSISINQIDKNLGKIDQTFLSDELLSQIAGDASINAVPADKSITNIKLADNTINNLKLTENFNYVKNLGASDNLDTITRAGVYLCIGKPINSPSQFGTSSYYLEIENFNTFYIQTAYKLSHPHIKYSREISSRGVATEWRSLSSNNMGELMDGVDFNTILDEGHYMSTVNWQNGPTDLLGKVVELDVYSYSSNYRWIRQECCFYQKPGTKYVRFIDKQGSIASSEWTAVKTENDLFPLDNTINGGDLNDVIKRGSYIFINSPLNNPLGTTSGTLEVEVYNNRWVIQRVMPINNPSDIHIRIIDTNEISYNVSHWQSLVPPTSTSKLKDKVIVNFGDSIFGNTRDINSISKQISSITGAKVYNCGFGGCRMSKHTGYWDAFSMYNLVDAIISKDFSSQEIGANAEDTSCPSYFKETVELLKTIDFNNVDYVTIAYGTNDYAASKNLDVGKGDKNIDAFAGALRYSIEKLLTNFPHIKLLICTPIWRWWEAEDGVTSDEKEYGGNTLLDYRDKVIEVCTDYHVPYLNGYDNVGINEFTKGYYFTSPDGTHPNALGNKRYAETIIGRLEQM